MEFQIIRLPGTSMTFASFRTQLPIGAQPFVDSAELHSIVSPVLTAKQTALFDNECAHPAHSKVVAFAMITRAMVAGLLTRSILWLDGK